jgi:hypothetical protein
MNRLLFRTTMALSLTLVGGEAFAQGVLDHNSRGMAVAAHLGGGFSHYGGGGGQGDIEFQYHFGGRYVGPGIGVGINLPLVYGFGIGLEGRFVYDIQPVAGKAFFVTPYVGAVIGFWNWNDGRGNSGGYLWLGPQLGLDLNFVLFDRLLLGIRPLGISIPIYFGYGTGWGYHSALTIGVTF